MGDQDDWKNLGDATNCKGERKQGVEVVSIWPGCPSDQKKGWRERWNNYVLSAAQQSRKKVEDDFFFFPLSLHEECRVSKKQWERGREMQQRRLIILRLSILLSPFPLILFPIALGANESFLPLVLLYTTTTVSQEQERGSFVNTAWFSKHLRVRNRFENACLLPREATILGRQVQLACVVDDQRKERKVFSRNEQDS